MTNARAGKEKRKKEGIHPASRLKYIPLEGCVSQGAAKETC